MTRQLKNRLDKLEKTIQVEHSPDHNQTTITRYHGAEARKMERGYILTMARARLGMCEPDRVIFISKRIKMIKEDYPGFPDLMTREHAKQLIEEYKNEID